MREELRREATLAFKYRDNDKNGDLQKQLTKFACSSISACANELSTTTIATSKFDDSTNKAATLKCANIHLKHRYDNFLRDKERVYK